MFEEYKLLKIGQKVWYVKNCKMEEGIINSIQVTFIREDEKTLEEVLKTYKCIGKKPYVLYSADFVTHQVSWYDVDYENKTDQCEFFDNKFNAYKHLAYEAKNKADKNRKYADKLDKIAKEATSYIKD